MPPSQRQLEERQMRQDRILAGALEVFKKEGFEGATMDEIASESGFGKATLYYYFHSKEEVFAELFNCKPFICLLHIIADNYFAPSKECAFCKKNKPLSLPIQICIAS